MLEGIPCPGDHLAPERNLARAPGVSRPSPREERAALEEKEPVEGNHPGRHRPAWFMHGMVETHASAAPAAGAADAALHEASPGG